MSEGIKSLAKSAAKVELFIDIIKYFKILLKTPYCSEHDDFKSKLKKMKIYYDLLYSLINAWKFHINAPNKYERETKMKYPIFNSIKDEIVKELNIILDNIICTLETKLVKNVHQTSFLLTKSEYKIIYSCMFCDFYKLLAEFSDEQYEKEAILKKNYIDMIKKSYNKSFKISI